MKEGKIRPQDIANGVVARVTAYRPESTFNHPITGIQVTIIRRISWRLRANGHVERTNAASKYQEWIDCEKIPQGILSKSRELGIQIAGGRQCGPWHFRCYTELQEKGDGTR